jgi:16S rRNA (cytosine1402-N4)-methyltransferase
LGDPYHRPALLDEVLEGLKLREGGVYVDATVGGGGHAKAIADLVGITGVVVGIDRDREALAEAEATLSGSAATFLAANAPFDQIGSILVGLGYQEVDGVLYDLGVSSHQLDDVSRGFTFREPDAPLDMRMDQDESTSTAADLLNTLPIEDMTKIFRDNADERWAARIALFVDERRRNGPLVTAGQLVEIVRAAIPIAARSKDIHPATKVFQALRIAVNDEFGRLRTSLEEAVGVLKSGGRLLCIAYHSGEDRIVKQTLAELSGKCVCPPEVPECRCMAKSPSIALIVRKPIIPSIAEIANNPRARSAKLRIAAKL